MSLPTDAGAAANRAVQPHRETDGQTRVETCCETSAGTGLETGPAALVSIHDLMPSTMEAVQRTLAVLERAGTGPVTLLVVPGSGWSRDGIGRLKALQDSGHRLAGHGWLHRVERFGGLYHRLHGLLISRRVAEHLALDANSIVELINRCHAWFGDNGFDPPDLYVPPAWAMGRVSYARLAQDCRFALYETFGGVLDAASGRLHRIPLLGYEADQPARVPVIRAWNAVNRKLADRRGRVRIGIHPFDTELRLRADLIGDLERFSCACPYGGLSATVLPGLAESGSSRGHG
jgi:predicted deacetylase